MAKQIEVAAAIVLRADGKILCTRRGNGSNPHLALKWEFPGGKLERGESPQTALARELREELALDVRVADFFAHVNHVYAATATSAERAVRMDAFFCVPVAPDAPFVLREHAEARFLAPENLTALDWSAADVPVAAALGKFFKDKNAAAFAAEIAAKLFASPRASASVAPAGTAVPAVPAAPVVPAEKSVPEGKR